MTSTTSLLALLLTATPFLAAHQEEPRSAFKEDHAKPRAGRLEAKEAKKKTAHGSEAKTAQDPAARLKALEQENQRLRQELAAKNGAAGSQPGAESASPEGALAELKAGNARFAAGTRTRTQMGYNDAALRATLAKGQAPFAVIVTCSDSRLGDNFIFDQELGRLFTVREAGNCPDTQSLASIEYAVEHLGSKVVVVMGHESCGAVKAVLESGPTPLPGNLWSLQAAMSGLVESVPHAANEPASAHMAHLVEANARRQAKVVLSRSAIVQHLCETGKLNVVPAVYELASGQVRFLPAVSLDAPNTETHH
ncbi:carbonic anhydrase [Geothrix sp. PMB-07]|uniref:carbonic anhydrase n=1 Tax=Geothrix sp. PMB-07 TaxID=3068640 RepID=UPI0027426808|nr:carbonic anhydrase [Geothrix sp. PMB-07]WLT30321.1 carbonic anhydrase [Geothrix sp. PMB-07]